MKLGAKRVLHTTGRRAAKLKRWCAVLVLVFLVLGLLFYGIAVLRPAFVRLAEAKAHRLANEMIHQTVSDSFTAAYSPEDVVQLHKTEDNKITAVTANLAGVSKLKSDLSLEILERMNTLNSRTLSVPIGSLTGNEFFYGLGPSISFQIMPYGTVETDVKTSFTEAGINQTKCDVTIEVCADLSVLMPTVSKKSTVKTMVPVVETVIVGEIPQSYTNVDREGLEYEDDVLQLAE